MIDLTKTYRRPNRSEAIKDIQRALNLQPDGIYGPLTEERVRDFQQEQGLIADGVCGPKTLARLFPENKPQEGVAITPTLKASRRKIKEIIVHCTATPEGKDFTVQDIRRWHTTPVEKGGRGWSDIGYHYVIYRDGRIFSGRDVNISGAHCTGHNAYSIGVVYVGGMDATNKEAKDTRTDEQRKSLLALLKRLLKMYPGAKVYGHCEFAAKECPSFEPSTLRTELRKMGCKP